MSCYVAVSGVPEGCDVKIICELANWNSHISKTWGKFRTELKWDGERFGPSWAAACRELGVDLHNLRRAEGGVVSANGEREIRFESVKIENNPLIQFPLEVPFVQAYVRNGRWTLEEVLKVANALRNVLVDVINGDEDDIMFRVEIKQQ